MNSTEANGDSAVNGTTPFMVVDSKVPFSIFLLFQLIVGFLGAVGNSFVCIVFLSCRSLRNQTNLLITNQAFVDFLSSVLIVLHRVYSLIPSPPPGPSSGAVVLVLYCYLWKSQLLQFASFSISTVNLTAIAVERYVAILYPYSYAKIFTRRNMKCLIPAVWLLAPILQYVIVSTTISLEEGVCIIGWASRSVGILLFLVEYLIPVCVMAVSFFSILRKFRSFSRVLDIRASTTVSATTTQSNLNRQATNDTIANSDPNERRDEIPIARVHQDRVLLQLPEAIPLPPTLQTPNRSLHRRVNCPVNRVSDARRRNVTTTLLVVFIMFIVCWSPNQLAYFQFNLGGHLDFLGHFYQISLILALCNTCVNPFIYALRHKAYRGRVRELYGAIKGNCITQSR